MSNKDKIKKLKQALECILDAVDYTNNACDSTEMVGAVLPVVLIKLARTALKETK